MRIALVTETYWPDINGVAMTLHRVFTALSRQGHNIQLVCTKNSERSDEHSAHLSSMLEASSIPAPGYAEVKFGVPMNHRLRRLWQEQRPNAIYVATEGPLGYAATHLARKLNIPVASGFHTNFQSYSDHYRLGWFRKLIAGYLVHMHNLTDCTIVPTVEQSQVLRDMGVHQVAVVGRGVDTNLFNPGRRSIELRQSWGANEKTPVMIYVGRIAEEKNLDLTLRCYDELKAMDPSLVFIMVGKGPAMERIRRTHPDIILTGPKTGDELGAHYASADFFPFTSVTETYGNVIWESMASGIGILSYHYAAGKIHIEQGENGYHVPIGDEAAYLQTAKHFLQDPVALSRMRRNASEHAQHYNWPSIAAGFEQVLQSLTPSKRASISASSALP
jgi:glycosyltransferase involved in cell wall biosynthesis